MYIATAILFVIPFCLLWVGWKDTLAASTAADEKWRSYCLKAGLVLATVATASAIAFFFSWTHNGGSPHGLDPSPGAWVSLRPIAKRSVILAVVLAAFGKGKGRLFTLAAAVSIFCVSALIFMLEMD